jgi:cytochrome c-type biogenesis protein CcmH
MMLFWILAITLTAIACAILLYAAARKGVNASFEPTDPADAAHRAMLADIERDVVAGRLSAEEAETARVELAREVLRGRAGRKSPPPASQPFLYVAGATALTVVLAFGVYAFVGSPGLPSAPLSGRVDLDNAELEIRDAISQMELHLAQNPEDLQAWKVIAPVYMGRNRFADAVTAFQRVIDLGEVTADAETDLAEAILMVADGVAVPESIALWRSAAQRDPRHVRSRFYLAGEATQSGRNEEAVSLWTELLSLADGSEPWFATAHDGLAIAQSRLTGGAEPDDQQEMIRGMVEGLTQRLAEDGGTIEEWTRLVRSRLVLAEPELAQLAYNAAVSAYPDAEIRAELDTLAREGGLILAGEAQ